MWQQHFSEAKRSLMRKPGLSALVVTTLSIGIALLMTMQTTVYLQSRVPLPEIADQRYVITADARAEHDDPLADRWRMPPLPWPDAQNLLRMQLPAKRYSLNYTIGFITESDQPGARPSLVEGAATDSQFFDMFAVPFLYGNPWTSEMDDAGTAVVVINHILNNKLFGGENSVGQTLTIGATQATIVGVMASWNIKQVFYDRTYSERHMHEVFVPMSFAVANNLERRGWINCERADAERIGDNRRGDVQQLMNSDCGWVNVWADIPDRLTAQDFRTRWHSYIEEQKALGRYPRNIADSYVESLEAQINDIGGDSWNETKLVMAYIFFLVCLVNTVGILLAKFLTHSKRVSLYRALGATKTYIMRQHLLEVMFLGLLGGAIGLIMSFFGLELMYRVEMYQMDYHGDPELVRHYFTLDWVMVSLAIATGIISVVLAGLYPIWKICNISPASQLKN